MESKEEQYKEMFLSEAYENFEELNRLFTTLEKDNANREAIDAIFRITHTLKGNALGMGFMSIGELSHIMEDIFSEIKNGKIALDSALFDSLFRANDKLGELIQALKTNETVSYKGIKTKLEVVLKKTKENTAVHPPVVTNINKDGDTPVVASAPVVDELPSDAVEKLLEIPSEIPEQIDEIQASKITFSDTVNIPVKKLDSLLNLVGELIIEKDSLVAKSVEIGSNGSEYSRLHRITSDLQYGVMDIRLVQIGFLFNKFQRIVRDAASIEKKKVELVLEGTEIEIDRNILKIMSDSLVHLVRNSVGHGIELPDERRRKGKPETGKIFLRARNEKETVIIEVEDDGAGIDVTRIKKKAVEKKIIDERYAEKMTHEQALLLIFEPGFSSAETINEISGRGVGMDVVKRATESIGGKIDVRTQLGKGSTIILSLPSSMALKGALLFVQGGQEFAIPLSYTDAVVSFRKKDLHRISEGLMGNYLGNTISLVFLNDLFRMLTLREFSNEGVLHYTFDQLKPNDKIDVLIVSYENKYVGFVVDKLLQQKEIVEKPLSKPLDMLEMFSGATILGNGNVCLVLDVVNILKAFFTEKELIKAN